MPPRKPRKSSTKYRPKDPKRPKAPRDPLADKALVNFFSAVDPERLRAILEMSDDERLQKLGVALSAAKFNNSSPMLLSRRMGVSLVDLAKVYEDGHKALGRALMAEDIPEIMKQNAADALPTTEPCPRCDGLKVVPVLEEGGGEVEGDVEGEEVSARGNRRCPKCSGLGTVRKPGLIEAKKLVFETSGLTSKGGGQVVQTQVNVGVPSLADTIEVREKVLGGGKVVENETGGGE
jgi:hypothetical protein